jgi:DNA-binding response OmpR family regulator
MDKDQDPIRVLVIDGSRNVRDFVAEQVLVPYGYMPILARDGAEGLRKALIEIPDLILMDYELPMMSGRDVLEALRARPLQIPVILMASRGLEQLALPLIRMGMRDYLIKPFTVDDLLGSIQGTLFEIELRREKGEVSRRLGQMSRRLKQCLIEMSIFQEIGRSITAQVALGEILKRAADAALYITQAEACTLLIHDPESGQTVERVSSQSPRALARPLAPEPESESDAKSGKVSAMLHVPMRVRAKEIGVLTVENKHTLRNFDDHHRQVLRILADYAAIAIENVRLVRELETQEETEVGKT